MARSTRFGLVVFAALLVVGGGYTAFWFLAARRIEAGIVDWGLSQRADKIDFYWQKMQVSGYPAAFHAADHGLKVTMVDLDPKLGGVCLNRGCIPSKALLHVARVIDEVEEVGRFGVSFGTGKPGVDVD